MFHVILSCVAFICDSTGSDQPSAVHFSESAAAMYSRTSHVTGSPGDDVVLLQNEETVAFDSEGKNVRTKYFLYKVLTQRGAEEWAEISCGWEPWHAERPQLRARVISADSSEHILDQKTLTDAPTKEFETNVFSDRRILRAPLPAVAPGSLVEEEQVFRERIPFFGSGTVERFYFGSDVTFKHTRLVLTFPPDFPIRYEVRLLPGIAPQINEVEGKKQIAFEYGEIPSISNIEPNLPSDVPAYPSVTYSSGTSWQQVADQYNRIVEAQLATSDVTALATKLVSGKKSQDEKTSAILQYVSREVRYTGVEFGDAAVVPRSPSEVLSRKYGDCKDKAALLTALLRAANVPAYIALLNVGSREDVSDLPGMGMFNHAIVYIPGPPERWVDATDEYSRLGELPTTDQGRLALIARPDASTLVRIPVAPSADNLLVENREVYLAESGPAKIVETSAPHGSSESNYRRSYANKEDRRTQEMLTNYVKAQYLGEKLDRFDTSTPEDLSTQFELVLESDHARRGFTDLEVAVAAIRLEGLFSRLPADLRQSERREDQVGGKKLRTADYQLPESFVTEWRYAIVPPQGFVPKALPKALSVALGPCRLTEEFGSDKNGLVHATLRFDTVKRRLTADEAFELHNKISQLMEEQPILIYFEPIGAELITEGKTVEGMQAYHQSASLHPKEAVPRLRIAKVLLAAGLGEAARSEAQAAVNLEPNSALAQKTLAEILEYDLVGRKFRPGSDYRGAEEAFRSAEKIDPDDPEIIVNLATLLEYNRWGLRYGPGARLLDAVAEYRKLKPDKLAQLGLQNDVSFALYYAGQFAEAEKNAEAVDSRSIALIVACEAVLHDSQTALTDAKRRSGDVEDFKWVAHRAGEMLANIRKYSRAADLEEAGASGDDASETAAYASLYRKTTPHEQISFPDDPVGVAMRYEVLTSDPDLTAEQLLSLTSKNGGIGLAFGDTVEQFVKDARSDFSSKSRDNLFPDVGTDLMITRMQPKVQGDDATGYKIEIWPGKRKAARFVVKEEGRYKLLATSRFPVGIGLEVLDRVAKNDLGSARRLLDWLREDQHIATGDDPLGGYPFPRLWTKGSKATAASIKIAAASILTAYKQTARQGLAVLEAVAKPSSTSPEMAAVSVALLHGYFRLEEYDKASAVCSDLETAYPESDEVFSDHLYALRALGRFDEANRLAEFRLKLIPDDIEGLRALAWDAGMRGDYARAQVLFKRVIDKKQPEAWDLNNVAWSSLFVGKVESTDLEDGIRAAELSSNDPGTLHTLGCIYAELGKTEKARDIFLKGMDSLNLDEPDSNYWYGFGRIAEQYGERDAALADYGRVTTPKGAYELRYSSYDLAKMRLRALNN